MIQKICASLMVLTLGFGMVGCDQAKEAASGMSDTMKDGVDSGGEMTKNAAGEMVPEGAKEGMNSAVDKGVEMTKNEIDKMSDQSE